MVGVAVSDFQFTGLQEYPCKLRNGTGYPQKSMAISAMAIKSLRFAGSVVAVKSACFAPGLYWSAAICGAYLRIYRLNLKSQGFISINAKKANPNTRGWVGYRVKPPQYKPSAARSYTRLGLGLGSAAGPKPYRPSLYRGWAASPGTRSPLRPIRGWGWGYGSAASHWAAQSPGFRLRLPGYTKKARRFKAGLGWGCGWG